MVAGTLVLEVGLLGVGGSGNGLFSGLCSWRGVSVGVMCAWWLAHCRCWWVDGFGIGLFVGFLVRWVSLCRLCVSCGWHIAGAGCVARWERGLFAGLCS